MEAWLSLILGGLPLLVWVLRWWNEVWYVRVSKNGAKLPPGHMGFPIFGKILTFLWYFKIVRRPDDFINSKRRKYGDGAGLCRTYLFGSPTVIACSPMVNKFVMQSDDFILQWPCPDLLGTESLVVVHGQSHARLRSYVVNTINRPDALRRIAAIVQPRLAAALHSWAQSPQMNVTFENIGEIFASIEAGPLLDEMDKLFDGLIQGVRAQPFNIPGTAFHHGLQEENLAMCNNKKGDFVTIEDISRLKYTNKVVEETIRLANILQFIFRYVTKEKEYEGYRIPKGWKVIVWNRYLHTDPENFEDLPCFKPDRWNNPVKPATCQVFGSGSRACPGNRLARLQIAIFLHHLSIGYKWELINPDAKMRYLPHPMPVDGVEITIRKL